MEPIARSQSVNVHDLIDRCTTSEDLVNFFQTIESQTDDFLREIDTNKHKIARFVNDLTADKQLQKDQVDRISALCARVLPKANTDTQKLLQTWLEKISLSLFLPISEDNLSLALAEGLRTNNELLLTKCHYFIKEKTGISFDFILGKGNSINMHREFMSSDLDILPKFKDFLPKEGLTVVEVQGSPSNEFYTLLGNHIKDLYKWDNCDIKEIARLCPRLQSLSFRNLDVNQSVCEFLKTTHFKVKINPSSGSDPKALLQLWNLGVEGKPIYLRLKDPQISNLFDLAPHIVPSKAATQLAQKKLLHFAETVQQIYPEMGMKPIDVFTRDLKQPPQLREDLAYEYQYCWIHQLGKNGLSSMGDFYRLIFRSD